jgi:Family of unknown function (DUF6627)
METLLRRTKSLGYLFLLSMLLFSIHLPAAQAGLVGTDTVINAARAQQDRQRLHDALNRDDVKARLIARGVVPEQVQARVDSLTDREVQSLEAKMDQMPAGGNVFDTDFGDALDIAVLVFLILLVTDILGFTNVYPFVKHPKR